MTAARKHAAALRGLAAAALAVLAAGCAASYQLTLMPRDSGRLWHGTADDAGGDEGPIAITIDGRQYSGTWVQVVPERTTGVVTGAWASRRHPFGMGGFFSLDNPGGGRAKALLTAPDGSGLRCDLRGGGGRTGGGLCRDDRGLEYDVQIRPASKGS